MGSTKMKRSIIFITLLFTIHTNADEFSDFKKKQETNYKEYKQTIDNEFKDYQKAYNEAFNEFSTELAKKWPTKNGKADISTKKKFIQYTEDLNSKKVIDYEKQNITLEVIAKSHPEAKKKIEKMFNALLTEDVKSAHKKDLLENTLHKKLGNPNVLADTIKLIIKHSFINGSKLDIDGGTF